MRRAFVLIASLLLLASCTGLRVGLTRAECDAQCRALLAAQAAARPDSIRPEAVTLIDTGRTASLLVRLAQADARHAIDSARAADQLQRLLAQSTTAHDSARALTEAWQNELRRRRQLEAERAALRRQLQGRTICDPSGQLCLEVDIYSPGGPSLRVLSRPKPASVAPCPECLPCPEPGIPWGWLVASALFGAVAALLLRRLFL